MSLPRHSQAVGRPELLVAKNNPQAELFQNGAQDCWILNLSLLFFPDLKMLRLLGCTFEGEQTVTSKLPHAQQLPLPTQGSAWEVPRPIPFQASWHLLLATHFQQISAEPPQIGDLELHFDLQ